MSYQSNPLSDGKAFDSSVGPEQSSIAAKKYYKKCYLQLKSQRTIFENLQPTLAELKPHNISDKNALMHFKAMVPTVLELTYAQIFTYYPFAIPELRLVMKPDLSPEIERFATTLLNSFLSLIRFENRLTVNSGQHLLVPAHNQADSILPINDTILASKTVMCHICENLVPANLIEQHSKNCELVYKTGLALMTTDERLKDLIKQEEKNHLQVTWPSTQEEAISKLIPTIQVISLIKNALKVETESEDAPTVLSSIIERLISVDQSNEDTDVQILCTNASRLIQQKLNSAKKFNEAMELASRTRVSKTSVPPKFVVSIAEFRFVKRISNGAFARVFLATKESLKSPVAIKVIPRSDLTQKTSTKRILTERNIMLHFNSPYTIKFFYSTIGRHNLYLVMEYLPGGDLCSLLNKYGAFPEDVAKNYAAQIVAALEYLRQNNVIHRDLKPDNILLDSNGHLKLVDFGLSYFGVVGRQTDTREQSAVGTPDYVAPEIITLDTHSYEVDYWSLGAMLYEFITGVPPFKDNTPQQIFSNVLCGVIDIDELKEFEASENCIDLIIKLLVLDPKKRLGHNSIDEIKNHPWFKEIDWDHLLEMPAPIIPEVKDIFDTSNFEEHQILNENDDSDILEDIKIGTDTVEIAAGDFDSQFVAKSMSVLKTTTFEEAKESGIENQIDIPAQTPHVNPRVQRRTNRTLSLYYKAKDPKRSSLK